PSKYTSIRKSKPSSKFGSSRQSTNLLNSSNLPEPRVTDKFSKIHPSLGWYFLPAEAFPLAQKVV
ncbi:MAG: hypothetical protein ACPHO8_07470, partial [Mariniblastus sp.]